MKQLASVQKATEKLCMLAEQTFLVALDRLHQTSGSISSNTTSPSSRTPRNWLWSSVPLRRTRPMSRHGSRAGHSQGGGTKTAPAYHVPVAPHFVSTIRQPSIRQRLLCPSADTTIAIKATSDSSTTPWLHRHVNACSTASHAKIMPYPPSVRHHNSEHHS